MIPPTFAPSPAAIGDERLWRTNPVYCVGRLVDDWSHTDSDWVKLPFRLSNLIDGLRREGIHLPHDALARWAEHGLLDSARRLEGMDVYPDPGVVGLVVDSVCGVAWVVPLQAEKSLEWSADPTLPFRPATVLQDLLIRLLLALGLPHAGAVPERFAFAIRDLLGRPSDGPSMDVAGLLAAVREANKCPSLLSRACALVQPDGDHMLGVRSVRHKLKAFLREYGRGTLLIRHRTCKEGTEFDGSFDQCWEVSTLKDLAEFLDRHGFLSHFLEKLPLDRADTDVVNLRLRRLEITEHRYADALDLASRVEACGYRSDVSAPRRRGVHGTIINLYRHLGYYEMAERLAREEVKQSRASVASSYDGQAQADANLAATLYNSHRFTQMERLLDPWCERLDANPLIVTPMTVRRHEN